MRAPKISRSFARFVAIRALMALLLFMTLAAWSMGSAVGGSPDEDYVLTSIWCGTEGNPPYCRKDPDRYWGMILPIMAAEPQTCYSLAQNLSANCQAVIQGREVSTDVYNLGLYPKRYLDFARNFVSPFVEASVVKIRLFNSFIGALLIFVTLSLDSRRLSDSFIAWLAVITPCVSYFIASVNTSSWTLIGTTCFVYATIAATKNYRNLKILIPASLTIVFSVWFTNSSRHEGKYAILFLALALLFSEFHKKKLVLKPVGYALVGILFTAMAYLVYMHLDRAYGSASLVEGSRYLFDNGVVTSEGNLLVQNFLDLPRFFLGFFGSWGLGWFEIELTHTVWLFSMQAFLLTTVFSLRKSGEIHRWIFVALFVTMCILILYANQKQFGEIGEYIQPRYFLPFFLGIVIIAAANKTERYPNSLVITVAILATISNSIALRDTIRRYTTGQDVLTSKSLNYPIEWWWQFGPQPETVWLTGTLAFATLWALLIYQRIER